MLRPVAPDPALIAWLWSYEGETWHRQHIRRVMHQAGLFAEIKNDHECSEPALCRPNGYSPHPDGFIFSDLRKYGISGVPQEWKER